MAGLRAVDVRCGWIVMTRLHEYNPFFPRAVVSALRG
jgi:hypothetical protein